MFYQLFQLYISTNIYPQNLHIANLHQIKPRNACAKGGCSCAERRNRRISQKNLVDFNSKNPMLIPSSTFLKNKTLKMFEIRRDM